jgi:hypothetical protein
MKIILNRKKATNIKIAYLTFLGLYLIGYCCDLQQISSMATIASGVAFGMYMILFFVNYKAFIANKSLFFCNICFLFTNLSFVYYSFEGHTNSCIFGLLSVALFLLGSKRTFDLLIKIYDPKPAT